MACDEGVVRRTRAPRAYAACLTNLAEHGLERRVQALSLGAWHRRPELVQRVQSLLARRPVLKPAAACSMIAVLGCGILASSTELARCPQLFGFVETPKLAPHAADIQAAANGVEGDAVLRPEMRMTGLHAVDTAMTGLPFGATRMRATIPVRHHGPALDRIQKQQAGKAHAPGQDAMGHELSAQNAGRQILLKAEAQKPGSHSLPEEQGQRQDWVVMTAMWEQREIAPGAVVSDSAPTESANAEAAQQVARPSRETAQVVVTRLVVEVASAKDPAAADGQQSANPLSAQQEGRKNPSAQSVPAAQPIPTIVPVRGGWLIFKL